MKKILFITTITLILTLITGCNLNKGATKGLVKDYYDALINQNYEEAFKISEIYDIGKASSEGTIMSKEEAKEFFMKKVECLDKANYKINDYDIVDVNQQDGHTFTYEIILDLEVNGKSMEIKERIHPKVDKENVTIYNSQDPLAKYRDGRVNFDIEKHWPKDTGME